MSATLTMLPPLATPADTRPTLVASPVCTKADALTMAAIRNECREGFSADTSAITVTQQGKWWAQNRNRVNAYLYWDTTGDVVAYAALLQQPDGTWVSSCAVLPRYAGQGYGRAILHHLVTSVDHEVYARARNDNEAALRLHNPGDWETTGADNDCTYFRTRTRVRVVPSLSAEEYR